MIIYTATNSAADRPLLYGAHSVLCMWSTRVLEELASCLSLIKLAVQEFYGPTGLATTQ